MVGPDTVLATADPKAMLYGAKYARKPAPTNSLFFRTFLLPPYGGASHFC